MGGKFFLSKRKQLHCALSISIEILTFRYLHKFPKKKTIFADKNLFILNSFSSKGREKI